jgi:LytS/YehU family sensor histidine kinase
MRAPVSAHFVNNVLAAAASYIEDDPDYARDVLAELGQFLSYRLREDSEPVPISQELAHVDCYLRLQQARFPDRIHAELPADGEITARRVRPGEVQQPLADALSRRLGEYAGPCRAVLKPGREGLELEIGAPGDANPERVAITLTTVEGMLS